MGKVERFGWTFAPGDKVMQVENDYGKEVYNGDIGMIDNVDVDAGEIIVSFDGRPVTYGFGELDMLVPAYAATIHKSQGSEYPVVIIRFSRNITLCCSGISSIPASPAANVLSCWLGKRRPSSTTFQVGSGGRNSQSGCVLVQPSRGKLP